MTFCLNPDCPQPENPDRELLCRSCGTKLLLGDRYRPIKPIGDGGFSRTFLGLDQYKPSRPYCAIKQFSPRSQGTGNLAKARALFQQEAIRLEELGTHPQIPDLLAHFEQDGYQYLIQEFIEGTDLEGELQELGSCDEGDIRQMLEDLLPVLQFVHDRKVIHRDIKPENIIRRHSDGQLVLVDFGASKLATKTTLARTGTTIGSAGYAAPEQTFGKAVFASDIYSLGVTCIHLLTQVPPFELFDSQEGTWVWEDFLLNNPISDSLRRILNKMLQQGMRRRYQSAEAVLADLKASSQPKIESKSEAKSSNSTSLGDRIRQQLSTMQDSSQGSSEIAEIDWEERHQNRLKTSYVLWIVAFLLGMGIRPLRGLHRFYNYKIVTGLLWMIPVVGDIGILVDLFLIPRIVTDYEEKAKAKLGVSETGVPLPPQNEIARTLPTPTQEQQLVKLLKAAHARGGKLSVTQAVMETGIGFSDVEELLKEMVKRGYVSVTNNPETGVVVYSFDELAE